MKNLTMKNYMKGMELALIFGTLITFFTLMFVPMFVDCYFLIKPVAISTSEELLKAFAMFTVPMALTLIMYTIYFVIKNIRK